MKTKNFQSIVRKSITSFITIIIFGMSAINADYAEYSNTLIPCLCYSDDYTSEYYPVKFYVSNPASTAYQFAIDDLGGTLNISWYNFSPGGYWWYPNPGWGGYMETYYIDLSGKTIYNNPGLIKFSYTIGKNDIQPGATRTFRFKYKRKTTQGGNWSSWIYGSTFSVGISDPFNINGSDLVCTSPNQTYTVTGYPEGSSFNWAKSSNLTQVGGSTSSTYTVHASQSSTSEEGNVQVIIHSSGCNFLKVKELWVGVPYYGGGNIYITGGYGGYPSPFPCVYNYGTRYGVQLSEIIPHANSYDWSGLVQSLYEYGTAATFIPNNLGPPYYGSGYIQVVGINQCGSSAPPISAGYGPCGGFMASPNPADSYVDINIDPEKIDPAKLTPNVEYILSIYDNTGLVKNTAQFKDFPYRITTESWKEGVYFIQIQFNDENYSLPITIEH